MDREQFVELFPTLFHLAAVSAWPGIEEYGLLSVSALCDLCRVPPSDRVALEARPRRDSVPLFLPSGATAEIRDQGPLSESKLAACLDDMTVEEWCRLLNRKVFFWPTLNRVMRLREAKRNRNHSHIVIAIDTALLVAAHEDQIALSPINAGAVLFDPPRRGRGTMSPIEDYDLDAWRHRRSSKKAIAEVSVDWSLPDLAAVTSWVERWEPAGERR